MDVRVFSCSSFFIYPLVIISEHSAAKRECAVPLCIFLLKSVIFGWLITTVGISILVIVNKLPVENFNLLMFQEHLLDASTTPPMDTNYREFIHFKYSLKSLG